MSPEQCSLHAELEERLRFETLIADLSSRFVNLPAGEVDREIEDALRRVCELLGVDLAVLWQWLGATPGVIVPTHAYCTHQDLRPSEPMRQDQYPWAVQQMLAGRMFVLSSLEEYPAEATVDKETCRRLGIKAGVCLPLLVGGEPPIGALGLSGLRAERDRPDALVQRMQLVAQVFANALARKRTEAALRASEARLAAGTELAGLGYYEVDYGERHCFLDDRFREISGVPPVLQQGLDPVQFWLEHIYPEDRQLVLDERQKLHHGKVDRISVEYRYLHPARGKGGSIIPHALPSRGLAEPGSVRSACFATSPSKSRRSWTPKNCGANWRTLAGSQCSGNWPPRWPTNSAQLVPTTVIELARKRHPTVN